LTPHVLSEWMVEVCRFDICVFSFWGGVWVDGLYRLAFEFGLFKIWCLCVLEGVLWCVYDSVFRAGVTLGVYYILITITIILIIHIHIYYIILYYSYIFQSFSSFVLFFPPSFILFIPIFLTILILLVSSQ
jgi:hypothetical protein